MSAIESKNLLVWVKAMSRGKALPLDASEVHGSFAEAQTYAGTAIAYPGQTVKALMEDGKYHEYILQPGDSGYTLEEVGAVQKSDLVQYVRVVSELPTSGQISGVIYINTTDSTGNIWVGTEWKQVFKNVTAEINDFEERISDLEEEMPKKAPIENPVFTGTVKVGTDEVALKSYVDGLISNLESKTPTVLNPTSYSGLTAIEAGNSFRVSEAGTYFGHSCEVGDLILVLNDVADVTGASASDVMVIQANIDGAVTSTAEVSTVGEIVVFDAVTGKVIKGSGVQLASLNDAISKAHEHSNKTQLDSYDKTQAELLEAAKQEAQGLVNAHTEAVNEALDGKADKATTLEGYGITDAYTKTEIDATVKTINDNLNTKTSVSDVEGKIAEAKTGILSEAAQAASEALEARVGSIPADTTIKSYVDTAVGSGGTASAQAIAVAKQEAIDTAKGYTDTQISAAMAVKEF